MSVSLYTIVFTPLTQPSKLSSQVANGPAIDVSTRREGITHRGIILSVLISVSSLPLLTQPSHSTHPNIPRPRHARAVVEMSSATFACILTGRDGVHARCLPNSLIHQLSPGRSQQEKRRGRCERGTKRMPGWNGKKVKGEWNELEERVKKTVLHWITKLTLVRGFQISHSNWAALSLRNSASECCSSCL